MKLISLLGRSDLHRHYNGSRPGSQEDSLSRETIMNTSREKQSNPITEFGL